MLVSANIKSKKELAQRLIDGEVFYLGDLKVYFDESIRDSPFKIGVNHLQMCWEDYSKMKKEINWWDNIPEDGILCWVSDHDKVRKKTAAMITRKEEGRWLSSLGCYWAYATPIKPEECLQYEGDN